ncbi:MAG: patatin-like phospholipase family protein [Bryobacterales bacterium]|nr:patatin-like phospholipase family protein [Bryobacterales bacterium]
MIWCALSLALFSLPVLAQQPRPKIGLALEGGGALGLAHLGVLEWLEDNRIPVDFIAGTSMGGLVGGLYAGGMSTKDLRQLLQSLDWDLLLGGQVPYSFLSYRRKEDRLAYPNRLELGLRNGSVQFPAGLNSGHHLNLLFSRTTLAYSEMKSFDDLPIPFRCVATEMIGAKETVFDSGSLADALRATMSMPAVFQPAEAGGNIYTDGGTLNNLPVDVVRRMGADIVIAVHLSTGPVDPKQLRTLLGVLGRTVSIVISTNELRNMQLADLVIVADLKGLASADYHRYAEFAERGRAGAGKKKNLLTRFALPAEDYQKHLAARDIRKRHTPTQVAFVEVEGNPKLDAALERRLARLAGAAVSVPALEKELTRAVGQGRFDHMGYRFLTRNGATGLLVSAHEKVHGPPFFLPAVEVDGKDQANVGFLFLSRFTFLDLGGYRSELRTDVSFGSRYGIATEYYRPFSEQSPLFLAPRAYTQDAKLEVYSGGSRAAEYRLREYGAGLDIGATFSRYAELRAGYMAAHVSARRRIGEPYLDEGGVRSDVASLRFNYEGQDDAVAARRGIRASSSLRFYPQHGFWQQEIRYNAALPLSPKGSLVYGLSGGTSFGERNVGVRFFSLGGPLRLGAYGPNELIGHAFGLVTAGYMRDVWKLPPLVGDRISIVGLAQAAKIAGDASHRGLPVSGTGMFVARTWLGPVYLGASWGDRGHRSWFFGLGRIF